MNTIIKIVLIGFGLFCGVFENVAHGQAAPNETNTLATCEILSASGGGDDDSSIANQIAEGSINTAEYPTEVKRMEQLALYEKLCDGDIQNPTTAMWELKDSLDQTAAAGYYLADQKRKM